MCTTFIIIFIRQLKDPVFMDVYLLHVVGYIDDLIREVVEACRKRHGERTQVNVVVPPPLCDALDRPDKEEAVARERSRFTSP